MVTTKDMILKGINQAQIIEELLKRKANGGNGTSRVEHPFYRKLEDMNKGYIELIKQFRALQKEKQELLITVEELSRCNKLLDEEFQAMCNTLKQFKLSKERENNRLQESIISQAEIVNDIDSMLDYIASLFDQG